MRPPLALIFVLEHRRPGRAHHPRARRPHRGRAARRPYSWRSSSRRRRAPALERPEDVGRPPPRRRRRRARPLELRLGRARPGSRLGARPGPARAHRRARRGMGQSARAGEGGGAVDAGAAGKRCERGSGDAAQERWAGQGRGGREQRRCGTEGPGGERAQQDARVVHLRASVGARLRRRRTFSRCVRGRQSEARADAGTALRCVLCTIHAAVAPRLPALTAPRAEACRPWARRSCPPSRSTCRSG